MSISLIHFFSCIFFNVFIFLELGNWETSSDFLWNRCKAKNDPEFTETNKDQTVCSSVGCMNPASVDLWIVQSEETGVIQKLSFSYQFTAL